MVSNGDHLFVEQNSSITCNIFYIVLWRLGDVELIVHIRTCYTSFNSLLHFHIHLSSTNETWNVMYSPFHSLHQLYLLNCLLPFVSQEQLVHKTGQKLL